MRKIIVFLLICSFFEHARVFAAEPSGVLMAAVVREADRRARVEAQDAQANGAQAQPRSGHRVLLGAAIGAAGLGIAAYATASCSVPPPNDEIACGTHYKGGSALIGAVIGAGAGALVGLFFRH